MLLFSPRAVSFAAGWWCRQLSLSIRSIGTKAPPHPQAGFTLPRPSSPFPVVSVPTLLGRVGRWAPTLAAARGHLQHGHLHTVLGGHASTVVHAPLCTRGALSTCATLLPICPPVHPFLSVVLVYTCARAPAHAARGILPCTSTSSSSACQNPHKLLFKKENDSCLLPPEKKKDK